MVSGWTHADGNPVSFTYVLNYDDAVQMADDSNTVNIFFYAQYRKLMPNVHYEVIRADIRQTNGTMKDNVITADLYDAGSHTKALEGGAGISNRVSYMGYVYEYTGDWTDGEHNVIYDDESDVDGNILRGPKAQINIINREGVSDPLTGIYYLNGVDNTRLTFRPIYIATMIQGLNVYYEDHVSTGSGSWSNRNAYEYNAEFSSMTHTFKDPSVATPTPHYQFLRWDMTGNTSVYKVGRTVENSYSGPFVAGGQYTYSINSGLPEGTVTTVRFAAVWQPSVTVQYHVPGSLAGSEGEYTQMEAVEKFDRVSVYEDFAAPEYEGAVFLGWFDEDGNLLSEETVYTAPEETTDPVDRYIVNVYAHYSTDYTVEHYLEDLDGTFGLDEASTETENGVIGTRVEAAAKEFPGFTLDRTVEGTVDAADLAVGTVLRLYYTRNVHKVTYAYTGDVPSGAPGVPAETTYRYGESVPAAALPALEGYTFSGWSGEVSTMPDSDVRVTGSWRQNPPAPVEPTTEADETTAPTDETTAPAEETTAPEPAPTPGPAPAPGPAPSPAPTPVPAVIPPSPVPAAPPEEADVNEPTAEETDDTEDPGSGGEIIEDETVPLAPGAEGRG